mmetsp:Transcript_22130/g.24119  ORF Transcript_22130/g.24119 Transcript_22130/m.24119 type:complete len:343 (-) Transcript_22130:1438-2466(-)|eukprot:gene5565-5981_t
MPETSRKRKSVSYKEEGSDDIDDNERSEDFSNGSEDDSNLSDSSESQEVKPKKKNAKTSNPPKKTQEKLVTINKTPPTKTTKTSATPAKSNPPSSSSLAAPTTNSSNNIAATTVIADGPPVTTDAAAKKLVLQYMKQQNRPYSLLQIFDNLHKRVPKATLERILGVMTGPGGELLAKEYGKSKIFYVDQSVLSSSLGSMTSSATSLDSLQEENSILQDEIDEIRSSLKGLQDSLSLVAQDPSDDAMDDVLATTRSLIRGKREELSRLRGRVAANPDPKALEKAAQRHNKLRQAWTQRKSLCMDAVDQLSEALGKKSRAVMDDLSLETDEEHNHLLPPVIKLR